MSDTVQFATLRALRAAGIALALMLLQGSATRVQALAISDFELAHSQWYVFQEADAYVTRCGQFNLPGDPDPCDASTQSSAPGGEQDLPLLDDFLISSLAPIQNFGNIVFTSATPVWLRIVDAGLAGVAYRPTFLGGLISEEIEYFTNNGYTTLEQQPPTVLLERPAGNFGNMCFNVAECWADPDFYVAELYLAPGSYAVRLQLDLQNPGPNDFGFVGVFDESILAPEPGTWVLMGAGLAALVVARRRR